MNWVLIYNTNFIGTTTNKPTSYIAYKTHLHKTLEDCVHYLKKIMTGDEKRVVVVHLGFSKKLTKLLKIICSLSRTLY